MIDPPPERLIDASVVMTLCGLLIVVSASVLFLDGLHRQRHRPDPVKRALVWAHVFYLVAAAGLELGKALPFALSASIVVLGTHCGLMAGYIGMRAATDQQEPQWAWLKAGFGIAFLHAVVAALSNNVDVVLVLSSLINGSLAAWFAIDVRQRLKRQKVPSTALIILPFAVISVVYYLRLALVGFAAAEDIVLVASIGIGLIFPMVTVFWLSGAMSLRNYHLNTSLDRAATEDVLTGLGNRVALDRFQAELTSAKNRDGGVCAACICIDLDYFKDINDTYGHLAGDTVLAAVAKRLSAMARSGDRIFRIGGDEFVLWRECHEGDDLDGFLKTLLKTLRAPIEFDAIHLQIGASLGVDVTSEDSSPWELIRRADIALYRSKETGRNRIEKYTETLGQAYDARLRALDAFRTALDEDQLVAFFQPQVNALTGELTGCEAFVRWKHPEDGILEPDVILQLAKELGVVAEVDQRVLARALEAVTAWDKAGTPVPRISVNVSASRLFEPALIEDLEEWRKKCPSPIALEMRETVLVDHDETLAWQADRLRELGVDIEVDDFGTGHASICAVLALQPQRIKIDGAFVADIDQDMTRHGVLRSLVDLARKIGAVPVIEGVETAEQLAMIQQLGSIDIQGFVVAEPLDFDAMSNWLSKRQSGGNLRLA